MRKNLLQRLKAPLGHATFGSSALTLGMPQDMFEELVKIANFDYMGNSMYEFGSITKSLKHIFDNRDSINLHKCTISGTKFLLLVNENDLKNYVEKIEFWAQNNYDGEDEYHGLKDIFNGENSRNIVGWLDITEHIMFFQDTNEGQLMAKQFDLGLRP